MMAGSDCGEEEKISKEVKGGFDVGEGNGEWTRSTSDDGDRQMSSDFFRPSGRGGKHTSESSSKHGSEEVESKECGGC